MKPFQSTSTKNRMKTDTNTLVFDYCCILLLVPDNIPQLFHRKSFVFSLKSVHIKKANINSQGDVRTLDSDSAFSTHTKKEKILKHLCKTDENKHQYLWWQKVQNDIVLHILCTSTQRHVQVTPCVKSKERLFLQVIALNFFFVSFILFSYFTRNGRRWNLIRPLFAWIHARQ